MHTIQLRIHDKVYEKFLWLLSKFSKEEVEIVSENDNFAATSIYLQKELDEINSGKAIFISKEDLKKD